MLPGFSVSVVALPVTQFKVVLDPVSTVESVAVMVTVGGAST